MTTIELEQKILEILPVGNYSGIEGYMLGEALEADSKDLARALNSLKTAGKIRKALLGAGWAKVQP